MENLIFYFSFNFEDDSEKTYGFSCKNVDFRNYSNFDNFIENIYNEITEPLESEFGVHDWSTSPVDNVNAIGYTTYEVSKKDAIKLMSKWREEFIKLFPLALIGEVKVVKNTENDLSIQKELG